MTRRKLIPNVTIADGAQGPGGLARIGGERGTPLERRQEHRPRGEGGDDGGVEPCHPSPSLRRKATIGEQQEQQRQDPHRDRPRPVRHPGDAVDQWQGAGFDDQASEGVLLGEAAQAEEEPRDQEHPPDRALGAARREHHADDRDEDVHQHVEAVAEVTLGDVLGQRDPSIEVHDDQGAPRSGRPTPPPRPTRSFGLSRTPADGSPRADPDPIGAPPEVGQHHGSRWCSLAPSGCCRGLGGMSRFATPPAIAPSAAPPTRSSGR